jgi:hypothetical protein
MYTYRNPITEIGDYSSVVPFNREFFVVEDKILTSNDILTPLTGSDAAIANKTPLPGATTIYRLIGNGVNEPTFDSAFSSLTGYGYNKEAGAVNTIVMRYDGSAFFYTVLRETPTPVPPLIAKDDWVGDFGYGPGVLSLTINYNTYLGDILHTTVLGVGRKSISVFDLIRSVHYTGADTLMYVIQKDGDAPVGNIDPRLAVVDYDCTDVGIPINLTVFVAESIGPLASQIYTIPTNLSDTALVCAP